MTNPTNSNSPKLPPDLLARDQAAQVALSEANARKAAADAEMSSLALAQTKYKSLVPDLTGVAMSTADDKSTGVAFSGLVTYSALNHAAEIVASQISAALSNPARQATMLVTSQSDLLTNDLLSRTVTNSLKQLNEFADAVLAEPEPPDIPDIDIAVPWRAASSPLKVLTTVAPFALVGGLGTAASAAGAFAASAGLGPFGLGAAAAAAIPSIISLFSSITTVKGHAENMTDLATTTSVMAALSGRLDNVTVVHEDFRLAPETSPVREDYQHLMEKRASLIFRQEEVQSAKNAADLELARAQQKQDAAQKAQPPSPDSAGLAEQVAEAEKASADASAALSVISGAIASIDAFTAAVNATAAGTRSPLAIASLNELLHQGGGDHSAVDGSIGYVLAVKGLGGQSEEYTKNRHVGFDSYTTLADASVAFMLYDVAARKIISSGIANGVSSVHGHLGQPPTGLIGPNAKNAIDDQVPDALPAQGQPAGPTPEHKPWWRRIF